jgi:hypothetical protein
MSATLSHGLLLNVSFGKDEIEIPVDLEFTFKPGASQTYDDPAEAPEIEFETIEWQVPGQISGSELFEAVPKWLYEFLSSSDDVFTAICEEIGDGDTGPDPDDERDAKIESARLRDG